MTNTLNPTPDIHQYHIPNRDELAAAPAPAELGVPSSPMREGAWVANTKDVQAESLEPTAEIIALPEQRMPEHDVVAEARGGVADVYNGVASQQEAVSPPMTPEAYTRQAARTADELSRLLHEIQTNALEAENHRTGNNQGDYTLAA